MVGSPDVEKANYPVFSRKVKKKSQKPFLGQGAMLLALLLVLFLVSRKEQERKGY